jgi:organic radical activating enzyme
MSESLFNNILILHKKLGCKTMVISGGEPTLHPKWKWFVHKACEVAPVSVILATNGNWLLKSPDDDLLFFPVLRGMMAMHHNLTIQVTNVQGFYPKHSEIKDAFNRFKHQCEITIDKSTADRLLFADKIEAMVSLGRAACDDECLKMASSNKNNTTSCFSSALVSAQVDLPTTIAVLESRVKLCHPLIDYEGRMHWSESCGCPYFFKIPEHLKLDDAMYNDICESAHHWRPCGQCVDYNKLLCNPLPKYSKAREILGIQQPTN